MTEKLKGIFSFIGRFALSAVLLVWLFNQVNWRDIMGAVRQADPVLLVWAFVITVLIQFVVLVRWMILMKALGVEAPFGQVCRYFFIGLFGNLFLPTSIGGDVIKAIGLSRGVGQKPKIFASIVLDRLSGFAGLVIVAFIAYFVGTRIVDAPLVIVPIVVLSLLSLSIGGMLFNQRVYRFFGGLVRRFPRLQRGIMQMHEDVMLMNGKRRAAFGCVLLSCLVQVMGAFLIYLISLALHLDVSFLHYLIFAPIVSAATFLPSIGGLGVREVGWKTFLTKVGVGADVAVGLSLVSFFFVIIIGLIGGVIYVTTVPGRRIQCDEEAPGTGGAGGPVA
jgi:uncharacterized protein (TIRG00374 family)